MSLSMYEVRAKGFVEMWLYWDMAYRKAAMASSSAAVKIPPGGQPLHTLSTYLHV